MKVFIFLRKRSKHPVFPVHELNFFFCHFFFCYSITDVCHFSPSLHPTPGEPTSLPHLHPPPWFCPCVLYSGSCNPLFPLSPPPAPPPPALAILRLFLTSMSLVIFCQVFSSIDYVPVKGEIIWYLSLTTWLISLSIMHFKGMTVRSFRKTFLGCRRHIHVSKGQRKDYNSKFF